VCSDIVGGTCFNSPLQRGFEDGAGGLTGDCTIVVPLVACDDLTGNTLSAWDSNCLYAVTSEISLLPIALPIKQSFEMAQALKKLKFRYVPALLLCMWLALLKFYNPLYLS
jgi:hypothetical protein